MTAHRVFKRVFGKKQKLDLFVWSMRSVVIILNLMPLYLMNYVRILPSLNFAFHRSC